MAATLDEETREVRGFVELLQQEQALLTAGDKRDALMSLAETKTRYIGRLEALSARREQLLTIAGKAKGRAGMEAWMAAVPANHPGRARWQELLSLAAEAKNLNETNGKLIGVHWAHNQAALTTLMSAANRAMVYGPDGQQRSGGSGRSFGKA